MSEHQNDLEVSSAAPEDSANCQRAQVRSILRHSIRGLVLGAVIGGCSGGIGGMQGCRSEVNLIERLSGDKLDPEGRAWLEKAAEAEIQNPIGKTQIAGRQFAILGGLFQGMNFGLLFGYMRGRWKSAKKRNDL